MRFWLLPKSCGWCVDSEDLIIWVTLYTSGICVQNCSAMIWGEGRRNILCFWMTSGFPLPTRNFTNGDRKALRTCLSKTVGSSCLQCHMTILSGHWTSASPYVKWKCEEDKKSCVFRRSVLKHRCLCVCVRGWGLESGCRFAVGLFLFLFLVSKLHKAGALLRRIWCRKAQATLKIQSSKENRKIKRKNGYHS